jgi:hypothetical protein
MIIRKVMTNTRFERSYILNFWAVHLLHALKHSVPA